MHVTRDFSHYVKDLGAGLKHIDLAVEGVSCAGCMARSSAACRRCPT